MLTVYGLKNCDTCRKAMKWLAAEGVEARLHDVRADGLMAETVAAWAGEVGLDVLLNRRGTTWRQLADADKNRDEAGLIALPREGLFLEAVRGTGAWVSRATGKRRAAEPIADGKRVLVSHGMPQSVRHALRDRGYEVAMGCGGAVGIAPLVRGVCAGLRYASNDLGVSVRGRISAAIARAAGAHVVGRDGEAFPEDEHTPAPILVSAAQERDARAILDVVAASGVAG